MASDIATTPQSSARPVAKVLVATTATLAFISYWRAAAIVLNDLASSAYYAGEEAEQFIGKTAPWFILAAMLFSYAVSQLYVESCRMFVRGGVYLECGEKLPNEELHHHDVVHFALDSLMRLMAKERGDDTVTQLREHLQAIHTRREGPHQSPEASDSEIGRPAKPAVEDTTTIGKSAASPGLG